MILTLIATAAVLAWLGLLTLRGGFWRADQRLPETAPPAARPEVVAVIPARDEAETIAAVIEAHGASAYPGAFRVVVVDDGSRDGTAGIARGAAAGAGRPVEVIEAPPLAPGWSGKLSALAAGVAAAARLAPEARYLLFTDADIRHAPDTLGRLVGLAEARELALVSLMARLDARGLWGGLLIPAFVFFFQKLYPFAWVNDPGRDTAAAAGGCVLIRRDALAGIGGLGAIRDALIDDCALAARVKRGPPRRAIWLGLAREETVSLRDNRRLGAVWRMVARTAFTELRHSAWLLAGSVAGMALIYLAGPVLALGWPWHGNAVAAALGVGAWAMAALAYRPTLGLYGLPALWAASLPGAALLYTLMTLDSARRYWLGRGGAWKGRTYP